MNCVPHVMPRKGQSDEFTYDIYSNSPIQQKLYKKDVSMKLSNQEMNVNADN